LPPPRPAPGTFPRRPSETTAARRPLPLSDEAEMRAAFRVFDVNGDGLIDADELRLTTRDCTTTRPNLDLRQVRVEGQRQVQSTAEDGIKVRAKVKVGVRIPGPGFDRGHWRS